MTTVAYAIPVEIDMIRTAEQARMQRERAIAVGIIKDTVPRQLRNRITSARQRLVDAQQDAARLELELQAHRANQPSEPANFREWMFKKFELEEALPK